MVKFRLGGYLRRFGKDFELDVSSAAEGLRGLLLQIPGLRESLGEGRVRIRIGGREQTEAGVANGMHSTLCDGHSVVIVPVITGAKNGLVMGVLGVVAIAAAFWTGGGSIATWAGASGIAAGAMGVAGIALVAAGMASMLTKTPTIPGVNEAATISNQYTSSLENRIGQGIAVPLLYGEMVVGSNVISLGLETE